MSVFVFVDRGFDDAKWIKDAPNRNDDPILWRAVYRDPDEDQEL